MTAWAATQSQMLRVRSISHVTRLNQTRAASFSGWFSTGNKRADEDRRAVHFAEGNFPPRSDS